MTNATAFSGSAAVDGGPSVEGLLLPVVDPESAPFWEHAAAGRLVVQACAACGRRRHPPRPMCPHCRSTERRWQPVSGHGTVWSFCVAHPPLLPAYAARAPYAVLVVALDDDPAIRFVGNLVTGPGGTVDEIDPATVVIGEPVRVVFSRMVRPDGSTVSLPQWVRAG